MEENFKNRKIYLQFSFLFFILQKTDTPLSQIVSTQSTSIGTSSSVPASTSSVAPSSSVAPVSSSGQSHSTPRDEIYIDDEGLEGSGGRGEVSSDHTNSRTHFYTPPMTNCVSFDIDRKQFNEIIIPKRLFAALIAFCSFLNGVNGIELKLLLIKWEIVFSVCGSDAI